MTGRVDCPHCVSLRDELDRAVTELKVLTDRLSVLAGSSKHEDFMAGGVHDNAERARQAFEAARATLDTHIATHGCEY